MSKRLPAKPVRRGTIHSTDEEREARIQEMLERAQRLSAKAADLREAAKKLKKDRKKKRR